MNFFRILKKETDELSHSRFLSWLLDPFGSHKLCTNFLKLLFTNIKNKDNLEQDYPKHFIIIGDLINHLGKVQSHNDCKVLVERNNIDFRVDFPNKFIIAFENKVNSDEHDNQLTNYKEFVDDKYKNEYKILLFFLTIKGHSPKEQKDNDWIPISYSIIQKTIDGLLYSNIYQLNTDTRFILRNYYEILRREVMGNYEIEEKLCEEIYSNNKDVIDEIITYLNSRSGIGKKIETLYQELEKGGFICLPSFSNSKGKKFTTKNIQKIFRNNDLLQNSGWGLPYPVMYEARFDSSGRVSFYCITNVVDCGDCVNEKIKNIIEGKDENFNKKSRKIPTEMKSYKIEWWPIVGEPDDDGYIENVIFQLNKIIREVIKDFEEKIAGIIEKAENS